MIRQTVLTGVFFFCLSSIVTSQVDLDPDSTTFGSKVNVNNTLYNNGMQYPTSDGQAGQVLKTDGDGMLSWTTIPSGGGNDFLPFYESLCMESHTNQIDVNGFGSSVCGVLFDSGGETGNYGNDEDENFDIIPNIPNLDLDRSLIRVIVRSLDIEDGQDELFIGEIENGGKTYTSSISKPDTLYFAITIVNIIFTSNGSNPGGPYDGFEIYWDFIIGNGMEISQSIPVGFYFDPNKLSTAAGVSSNGSWENMGEQALLLGYGGQASAKRAISVGYENFVTGISSQAFGRSNRAFGIRSTSLGYLNRSIADGSTSVVSGTIANTYLQTSIGAFNDSITGSYSAWVPTEPIFMIGNGDDFFNRSTALTILKNGHVGIGTMTPSELLYLKDDTDDARMVLDGADFTGITFRTSSTFKSSLGHTNRPNEDWFFIYEGGTNTIVSRGGLVGIRTIAPTQTLSVNGSAGKPGGGTWATFSDRRLKQHIRPFQDGLEQILAIEPVFYQYNGKANTPTDQEYVGVIAQDMAKIADYMVNPVSVPHGQETNDYLSYDGTALPYMLVNAVQELHQELDQKEKRISQLESQIHEMNELQERLDQLESLVNDQSENELVILNGKAEATLEQNVPNPFRGVTRIGYFVPEQAGQAYMLVHDAQGREIKRFRLQQEGNGQVNLQTRNLAVGRYSYSLYVDGTLIDTRQMVLER